MIKNIHSKNTALSTKPSKSNFSIDGVVLNLL